MDTQHKATHSGNIVRLAWAGWLVPLLLSAGCTTYNTEVIDDRSDLEQQSDDVVGADAPTPGGDVPGDVPDAPEDPQFDASVPQADDAGEPPPAPPGAADCDTIAGSAELVMDTYCAGCHGGGIAQGGFGGVLNVPALIATGRVVPGDPDSSTVYTRPAGGTMPPVGVQPQPTPEDLQVLSDWISCGAPDWDAAEPPGGPIGGNIPFMDFNDKVFEMHRDVRGIAIEADRENVRYIDFTPLSNAGLSDAELEPYRQALALQVNSLSTSFRAAAPRPINSERTIYRIDITDYGWDEDTWRLIEAEYPFAVRYDEDSRLFPYDELTAERLRDETRTDIPFVQVDWFLATVSLAPLYYDILGIPDTLDELAGDLGVDIDQDVRDERAVRAGISNSSVALNRNRVDQHHDLPGNQGSLWLTFDFLNNQDERSIFAFPLDFIFDGSEAIHHLPNGMQAYSIWDQDGNRLNEAPRDLASTPNDPQGELSIQECNVCHAAQGMVPMVDAMNEFALTGFSGAQREAVLALYPGQDIIDDILDDDNDRFAAALRAAGVTDDMASGTNLVYRTYEAPVTLARAAGYLEVSPEELAVAIAADPGAFPPDIAALRNRGGTAQLDAFLAGFAETVEAMGLGEAFP